MEGLMLMDLFLHLEEMFKGSLLLILLRWTMAGLLQQGNINFLGGITLLGGTVTLTSVGLIESGVNLRHSSTLDLYSDLHLGSSVTFSSSSGHYFNIDANGNTIYLNGDLTLADDMILEFLSGGIIDGQGHNLKIGHRSQLLIDGGMSVTLRNLTVKNTLNTFAHPALRCIDWFSHLTLDNTLLALNDDFARGSMFSVNIRLFDIPIRHIWLCSSDSLILVRLYSISSPAFFMSWSISSSTKRIMLFSESTAL